RGGPAVAVGLDEERGLAGEAERRGDGEGRRQLEPDLADDRRGGRFLLLVGFPVQLVRVVAEVFVLRRGRGRGRLIHGGRRAFGDLPQVHGQLAEADGVVEAQRRLPRAPGGVVPRERRRAVNARALGLAV